MDNFEVILTPDGKIIDFLSETELEPNPEEFVRQRFLRILHYELSYPKSHLRREASIHYGRKQLQDSSGNPVRADIAVYSSKQACDSNDPGKMLLVVECKAPTENEGYEQLVSYIYNTSATGGVWFNGDNVRYFRRLSDPHNELTDWIGIPREGEAWDSLGRRKKADLKRPRDIKGLLRRCHNKLHGRGVDGDEEDLTMDMVRIILAKAMDEEQQGDLPNFYCTPEEYKSNKGRAAVAERVSSLFAEVVDSNQDVFASHERISVGERAICDVVVELQTYRMLSDLNDSEDWDIMGYAYEQYTATYLKRSRGQFFTNRLIVDLIIQIVDPQYRDIILDPAGGSGGFLTGAMRHVRNNILSSDGTKISKQRQLDRHRTNLFMVEISKRLVKIAKTAMILNGDGHTGMTQGDSLGDLSQLDDSVRAKAGEGKPSIILTNPPFAGVGDGRITDEKILSSFQTGIRWSLRGGSYSPTDDLLSDGAPPEMLFFERCITWLAPGGRMGIVMPKSFLDTQTYFPARHLLFSTCKLLAVVNCHKDTFQPHTGVRTCLLFIEKKDEDKVEVTNYPIFMAISKKIGQDSEGVPIFKRDSENHPTDEIDHDLNDILEDYKRCRSSTLTPSTYRFSVLRDALDERLIINPQFHLPDLNLTIKKIEEVDGRDGWTTTTLGAIDKNVQIFKGPRLKTENLIVEISGPNVEPYYTPTAVLQEKGDSAKLLDLSRATPKQIKALNAVRVRKGDIVITRSGSIGRIAIITNRLDNAIVSDDLIRVRIQDKEKRAYIFAFLQSVAAQNQILRNEYGAVQQHLEPIHISDILVPVPENWNTVASEIDSSKNLISRKEEFEKAISKLANQTSRLLESIGVK